MIYEWIRKWGELTNTPPDEIERRIHQAIDEEAPQTAITRRTDGTWRTLIDISSSAGMYALQALDLHQHWCGCIGLGRHCQGQPVIDHCDRDMEIVPDGD